MAARQGTQSNAMLYTLITFVALFIIATVCAVVFYLKSEEYKTGAADSKAKLDDVAQAEKGSLTKIVGKPIDGKSYLGTMNVLVDDLYKMILGKEVPANTPATVKFNEVSMTVTALIKTLGTDTDPVFGPDGVSLVNTISDLKQQLEIVRQEVANFEESTKDLQMNLNDASQQLKQERDQYLADLNKFQGEVDEIRNRFDGLKATWEKESDDLEQGLKDKLEVARENLRKKQLDLETTEKKLEETDQLLDDALVKIEKIKPRPNIEVQAFKPDASIVRIDLQNGIVYLNVGTNNRIYRGLTFAIYDRNQPIPESGEGKAEIEVFQTNEQACAARIIKSNKKNPIVKEDIVANLIWDSKDSNKFVVAGDFDMNNDGRVDTDGRQQVVEMVERWGGTIMDEVTVDTDFIVVGITPKVLMRPSEDEIDIDPMAQQRYEQSKQKVDEYNALIRKANDLSVPVFNQNRFLYLIGFETMANKNTGI